MKNLLKKATTLLVGIGFAMSIVGCSSNHVSPNQKEMQNEVVNKQSVYPVTVTDSYGEQVTLETEPERIVSVAPAITEMVYALDAEDKLVGRTDYCDYPEEVSEIESVGAIIPPDIEKIMSLEPDLVITSTHFDEENAEKLRQIGIPVIELFEEFNVEGVYDMLETLGVVLNKQEVADDIVEDMKTTISEVQKKVAGLEEPTVYYVVGYGEYGDFSAPENTFVGQLIKLAGGKDIVPASDSWSYSLEALLEADPDIIIVRKGDKEGFMTTPGYNQLTAVKENHVYEIDNNLLDRQGNRNAEGVLTLAKIIHPEAFKN
ncbi:MAG: ABC transporter substrate-binding protein [Cellulosilyticum sp.]|nr:ABC transporter substrate-binding protein [Cellulosilyticum sp.]